jgi:peptidoglycan/LPS O-acetylase OafA/YrhL
VEEQFYLSWPLAMRWGASRIVRIAVALLVIATLARIILLAIGVAHPGIWCDTFARLDPIAGGAWFAYVRHRNPKRFSSAARLALIFSGASCMVATGAVMNNFNWTVLPGYPLVAAAAVEILAGCLSPMGRGSPPFLLRSAAYLGKISYATYVFHRAVLTLCGVPFAPRIVLPARAAMALIATILLAAISYRYLESPFLRLKDRFSLVRSRPIT